MLIVKRFLVPVAVSSPLRPDGAGTRRRKTSASPSTASCAARPRRLRTRQPALVRRLAEAVLRLAQDRAKTKPRPTSSAARRDAVAKLTDEQKKTTPPANGRWDKARKRVLFADRGDIVMLDAAGARKWITRTTAGESSPRWASTTPRSPTSATATCSSSRSTAPALQQLTDVAPKKIDPRLTDSQKFMREEEEKLLEAVKEQKDGRRRRTRRTSRTSCRRSSSRIASRPWI